MTQLLEKVFQEVSNLPYEEQNYYAHLILNEMKSKNNERSIRYTEMSDEEVLLVAEQSGSFDFLNDPSEDIYTLQDGEPI